MQHFIFLLSFCISLSVQAQTEKQTKVYRWVTESGDVVFSDQPVPGAKPLDLSTNVQNTTPFPKTKPTPAKPKPAARKSISLTFADIEDQATVRNATGELTVTAQLGFYMQLGVTQKLLLLFDGSPVGAPQSELQFKLADIDRGEHTLQLKLINAQGDTLSTSEKVTFYMHRPFKAKG